MAETFTLSELVIPGTYIRVQAEALIGVGGISTGNIGIAGSASNEGLDLSTTYLFSDYTTAQAQLGRYDPFVDASNDPTGKLHLTRAVELLYKNGARSVYARALAPTDTGQDKYTAAFNELIKDDVNILVAPQLSTADALAVLGPILDSTETAGKDLIAVVGSDATTPANIKAQVPTNGRIIMTAPGIRAFDSAAGKEVTLSGTYTAAAVAGLLSTLTPQTSPTNKILPAIVKLAERFSYGEIKDLTSNRVLVLEQRQGVRVVRGISTDNGAFKQITTRRITDFAKAGIRQVCDPFIGRLNNQRVRKALQGAIDGFLTTMVQDEALINYTVAVTATRTDEINNRALVNVTLQPTFSIDFIAVTLVLQ